MPFGLCVCVHVCVCVCVCVCACEKCNVHRNFTQFKRANPARRLYLVKYVRAPPNSTYTRSPLYLHLRLFACVSCRLVVFLSLSVRVHCACLCYIVATTRYRAGQTAALHVWPLSTTVTSKWKRNRHVRSMQHYPCLLPPLQPGNRQRPRQPPAPPAIPRVVSLWHLCPSLPLQGTPPRGCQIK
jgi:hypothetical protein